MKKIIVLLLLIMVGFLLIPIFLPKTIHEEVEYTFDASPEKVYNEFYNIKKMSQWFAWAETDESLQKNFSSITEGIGATYEWTYEGEDGGQISITDAKENQFVGYKLEFGELENGTSEAIFQAMEDGKTKVIWTFDTPEATYPYQVYYWLVKGKVKKQLEIGLDNLAEKLNKESSEKGEEEQAVSLKNVSAQNLFGVTQTVEKGDEEEMQLAEDETWGYVQSYLIDEVGVESEGLGNQVKYILNRLATEEETFVAGFFVNQKVKDNEDLRLMPIPAYKVVRAVASDNSESVKNAYERIEQYAKEHNLQLAENAWQVYDRYRIEVYVPVLN